MGSAHPHKQVKYGDQLGSYARCCAGFTTDVMRDCSHSFLDSCSRNQSTNIEMAWSSDRNL